MMRSKLREALAHTITELRPSWDIAGVRKALDHPDLTSVNENAVVLAAIRCAVDPKNRTPAVIPMQGAHWELPSPKDAPTPIPPRFEPSPPLSDAEQAAADQAAARAREALALVRSGVSS